MKTMRSILFLAVAVAFTFVLDSCKKCNNCVRECKLCVEASTGTNASVCRESGETETDYTARLNNGYPASGWTCTAHNEEEKVCTSGIFYKLRQSEAVDAKESEGYVCD